MNYEPTPVSRALLQRLDLRANEADKVFVPNRNAGMLAFSLQKQRVNTSSQDQLVLVIHNDNKPLVCLVQNTVHITDPLQISIRLTSALRNSHPGSNLISTNNFTSTLCITIPNPNYKVTSYFEDARDFRLAIYTLERSGFSINAGLQPQNLRDGRPLSRTASDNIVPMRLSSMTSFQSQSQPELYPSGQGSLPSHSGHQSQFMGRAESFSAPDLASSIPPLRVVHNSRNPNPYTDFAADFDAATTRASEQPFQNGQTRSQIHPRASTEQLPTWEIYRANYGNTYGHQNDGSFSRANHGEACAQSHQVEKLDDAALRQAADFRLMMPQARDLPFPPRKEKDSSSSLPGKAPDAQKRKTAGSLPSDASATETAVQPPPAKKKRTVQPSTSTAKKNANQGKAKGKAIDTASNAKTTEKMPMNHSDNEHVAKRVTKTAPAKKGTKQTLPNEQSTVNDDATAEESTPVPKQTTKKATKHVTEKSQPAQKRPPLGKSKSKAPAGKEAMISVAGTNGTNAATAKTKKTGDEITKKAKKAVQPKKTPRSKKASPPEMASRAKSAIPQVSDIDCPVPEPSAAPNSKSARTKSSSTSKVLTGKKVSESKAARKKLPTKQVSKKSVPAKKASTSTTASLAKKSTAKKPTKIQSNIDENYIESTNASSETEGSAQSNAVENTAAESRKPQLHSEKVPAECNAKAVQHGLQKLETLNNIPVSTESSTFMVTEPAVLQSLNEVTEAILAAYEADVREAGSRFDVAQFYVEQLHNTRLDFWYEKLQKGDGMDQCRSSCRGMPYYLLSPNPTRNTVYDG